MQAKIFKREKERLYLDEKGIATSKNLIKKMGFNIPSVRPDDNETDLNLIKEDFDKVDGEVRTMQTLAQMGVYTVPSAL